MLNVSMIMNDELRDEEGSSHDLFKKLSQHLSEGNEEKHEALQSGYLVPWQRYDPQNIQNVPQRKSLETRLTHKFVSLPLPS